MCSVVIGQGPAGVESLANREPVRMSKGLNSMPMSNEAVRMGTLTHLTPTQVLP